MASLEGYGAPVIDIGHWFMESDLTAVVGVLRNFVPERIAASTGAMARFSIDDGDIFIGEFASGAICSVQSSFVTVGNYPGIEVRVYGDQRRETLPSRAALGEPAARRRRGTREGGDMSKVRWGILGTANIAQAQFLPGLREAGGAAAAVAGRDAGRAGPGNTPGTTGSAVPSADTRT